MILDVNSVCNKMEPELITFIHNIILLIKIAIPIILVIFGMLDFAKGVMASKEDEIKKGQHTFIQRLIAAVVVFFMISISQLVISIVDKDSDGEIWKCANAIMNGDHQFIREEKREYDEISDYCCQYVGGELDSKNVCHYPEGKGNDYGYCVKYHEHEKQVEEEKKEEEQHNTCCVNTRGDVDSNGKCTVTDWNAYSDCLKKIK